MPGAGADTLVLLPSATSFFFASRTYLIAQNIVTWPCLAVKKAGKYSLLSRTFLPFIKVGFY